MVFKLCSILRSIIYVYNPSSLLIESTYSMIIMQCVRVSLPQTLLLHQEIALGWSVDETITWEGLLTLCVSMYVGERESSNVHITRLLLSDTFADWQFIGRSKEPQKRIKARFIRQSVGTSSSSQTDIGPNRLHHLHIYRLVCATDCKPWSLYTCM